MDTDFTAKLIDVYPPSDDYPDGYAMNLCDSIQRMRYRNGYETPEMIRPGEVYEVTVELPPTSNPVCGRTSGPRGYLEQQLPPVRSEPKHRRADGPACAHDRGHETRCTRITRVHLMWCCRSYDDVGDQDTGSRPWRLAPAPLRMKDSGFIFSPTRPRVFFWGFPPDPRQRGSPLWNPMKTQLFPH